MILQELTILQNIWEDLTTVGRETYRNKITDTIFWRDSNGYNILADEDKKNYDLISLSSGRENVIFYSDVILNQLDEHRSALENMSPARLKQTQCLREKQLEDFYNRGKEFFQKIESLYPMPLPDQHRIYALWDLSNGFIIQSLAAYNQIGVTDFMHLFHSRLLPEEIDFMAYFADNYNITDSKTFKRYYHLQDSEVVVLTKDVKLTQGAKRLLDKIVEEGGLKKRYDGTYEPSGVMQAQQLHYIATEIARRNKIPIRDIAKALNTSESNVTSGASRYRNKKTAEELRDEEKGIL